jgi:PAS domain S-box-containing protein
LLPSSAEEGRALAQPAPGWCDHRLPKAATMRFVHKILERGTKYLNDGSRNFPQTTPVPSSGTSPPEARRGAIKTSNLQSLRMQAEERTVQLTIRMKLGIGLGVLLGLLLIIGWVSYSQLQVVARRMREVTEIQEPVSTAAQEMEINLVETGFALLGYLHDRDSIHLERIRDAASDFAAFQKEYYRLAETAKGRELGSQVAKDYARFREIAGQLIGVEDLQKQKMQQFLQDLDALDGLLDEKIQASVQLHGPQALEKLRAVLEMEVHATGIAKGVGNFHRTHAASHEDRLLKDEQDFKRYSALYGRLLVSARERQWVAEIETLFGRTAELAREIVALDKAKKTGLAEFVRMRRMLDQVLDDEIQAQVQADMTGAKEHVQAAVAHTSQLIVGLLLTGLAFGSLVGVAIARSITIKVKKLVAATQKIAHGDFSQGVTNGSSDEFGILAESFNAMAGQRQRAEEQLRTAHDNLETQVQERTADLVKVNEELQRELLERRRAEEKLLASQTSLALAQQVAQMGSWELELLELKPLSGQNPLTWSDELCRIFGYEPGQVEISTEKFFHMVHPDDREAIRVAVAEAIRERKRYSIEHRIVRPDGTRRLVREQGDFIYDETGKPRKLVGVAQDITEQRELEEQLRQSQKMEAIGKLAGGVAHDFNNLLTAIIGHTELSLSQLEADNPSGEALQEISKAAQRAATLTSQLLAFSRKQILQPKVLNLNGVVSNLEKMLRRLIGEDIEWAAHFGPELGLVRVDPGQLEQVLMNLVVNARDAMPKGGKLTIETDNVELDEAYAQGHVTVTPGRYVMLAVSDTGVGMDAETQARIFEPFFTTKELGKGTGLGLSTVYGIVKQSGGNIWVYSEPGRGTIFKVYLPRVESSAQELERTSVVVKPDQGSETILVVEDNEAVRSLVCRTLRLHGYQVIEAVGGTDALRLSEQSQDAIYLMLTDVVMPQMSGPELAARLMATRPSMKVLYMSGFTDDVIVHPGNLDSEVSFIQKPFTPGALAQKVREILDGEGPRRDPF